MAPTSERPSDGHASEAAEQAAVSASAGYQDVERSIKAMFDMLGGASPKPEDIEQRVGLLEDFWQSEQYTMLPKPAQDALRARYGAGLDAETVAPAAAAPKEAAGPERKEGRKPIKWQFVQYRIAHDGKNDRLFVVEDSKLYDKTTDTTETKQGIPTLIRIPDSMREKLMADPDTAVPFIEELNDLRHELDKSGVKLFLDEAKWDITKEQAQNERSAVVTSDGSVKRLYLKWKYQVGDRTRGKDFVDFADVPDHIVKLLKEDKEYWKRSEWNKWFGPTMQKKREAIISDEVERIVNDETWEGKYPSFEGPEMETLSSTEVEETDETVEVPTAAPRPALVTAPPAKTEAAAPTEKPAVPPVPAMERPASAVPPKPETVPAVAETTPAPVEEGPLTEERVQEDIYREVQKSLGSYRFSPAFRNAPEAALKEQVVLGAMVMLQSAYRKHPEVTQGDALKNAVQEAAEALLQGREWTPTTGLVQSETAAPERSEAPAPIELRFTALLEGSVLRAALTDIVEQALAKTDHAPSDAASIAASLQTFLASGKKLRYADYVPGKSFTVTEPDRFMERVRVLHKGLKERG